MESVLRSFRAKRGLLIVGVILLIAGSMAHIPALVVIGVVLCIVGLVSSGGV